MLKSLNADKMPSWLWKMYGPNLLDDNFIINALFQKLLLDNLDPRKKKKAIISNKTLFETNFCGNFH